MNMALEMDIDPLGAQPSHFKLYTQLALIYETPDPVSQSSITSALTCGLERLSRSFPWVAGQVVNVNPNPDTPPEYKIRPLEPSPLLVVKDFADDTSVPNLAQMRNVGYPMLMMKEELWAPCPTLAMLGADPSTPAEPARVMLVQCSFIKGGIVLCVNTQHNACDMMGQAAIMEWLSKACRGEDFTDDEIRIGNMERKETIPLIKEDGWSPGPELEPQSFAPRSPSNPDTTESQAQPPKCSWTYFDFSEASLNKLKSIANDTLPQDFSGFISTDDAFSAFIFQSVLRARQSRLSPDRSVTFGRAVDARRYVGVPANYPGMLTNMAYVSYPLSILLSTPLGAIATAMRKQVDPTSSDVGYRTRSIATFLAQSPGNASKISLTAKLNLDSDIALSSWTKVQAYDWDFGFGLGAPVAVRRPCFLPVESLMYPMPKDRNGDVSVAMCLRDTDIDRLREDPEWAKFAKYIG